MLIDSHCHINFRAYEHDAEAVIQRALASGVWLVNIGSQDDTSRKTIEIAEQYPEGVYAVVGLHPIHLNDDITESLLIDGVEHKFTTKREEFDYQRYWGLARSSTKVVGLGETGLDYFYFPPTADQSRLKGVQQEAFQGFIDLANELNLPLVIHARGSKDDPYGVYDDLLEIIKKSAKIPSGVVHCFGGNLRQAREFMELGFYIGFTGIVTFKKKAEELQEIVRQLPLAKILVETDAPFLSPEPHRGRRNEPAYVKFVAEKIAALKNLDWAEVAAATTANAKNLFNLDSK